MDMKHRYPSINLVATGKRIAQLRKERGLSVRDMQDYFGFEAPQAIYKWQNGTSLPTVDNLFALSMLLEVPMESILVTGQQSSDEPQGSVFLCSENSIGKCFPMLSGFHDRLGDKKYPRLAQGLGQKEGEGKKLYEGSALW